MKLYLIRHGETTGDVEDRYGGNYDDHLTDLGRKQLQETANNLVGKDIEIIFTSPLIRAKEASEIIASSIHCPVEENEGWRERHYGILAGLTKKEALEKYPEVVETHKNSQNTDLGGESYKDFQKRVLSAFKDLSKENYKTIAVVSHSGPIRQILAYLGKNVPEKLGDGEIIEIEF